MRFFLFLFIALLFGSSFQGTSQTILFEDFTSVTPPALPTGWTNSFTAAPGTTPQGWVTITQAADYFFNYSTPPHPQYVECTEYYHIGNDPANLTSPSFSLAGTTAPYLSFNYLFNGSHYYYLGVGYFEEMYIQLSTDGGSTWINLDTLPVGGYWDIRFIDLAAYAGNPDCRLNFRYTDSSGSLLGALLTNVRVFNLLPNDIALTAISPVAGVGNFVTTTSGISFGGLMTNTSPDTISSFSATYQVGAGTPVTTFFSGLSVAPLTSYSFTCTPPYTPTILDSMPVTMWVTESGDPVSSNDTMTTSVVGITHFPVKKPVAEEATATWCDACPYGIIAMDSCENLVHENMSFIAVHCSISTSDPMTNPIYGMWIQGQIPQYPYLLFDRKIKTTPDQLQQLYNAHHNDFGYADVSISATVTGDSVTVPVSIIPATNLHSHYRVALVLTEDFVHSDVTPSDWDQANLYTGGGSGAMADAEYDFAALPNPVPATTMYYDHVARSIVPSVAGGTYLPATLTGGSTYSCTFTVPFYTWSIHHMHAIVMLIDSATGYIVNSNNIWIDPIPLQTAGITTGPEHLAIYPNPATTLLTVSADENISTVTISNVLGQVIYAGTYNALSAQIDVADLQAGIYLVKVNGSTFRKFTKL